MELHDALRDIATIRDAAVRAEIFRGYRAASTGFSAALGITAAIAQSLWIPQPLEQFDAYLNLWGGVALVSLAVVVLELWSRARQHDSPMAVRQTWQAAEQFLPCLIAGALLTFVISERAGDVAWTLPSLWATLFSLGMFASLRFLPRPFVIVAIYYLACGVLCLCWSQGEATLSPWAMGLTFGIGQTLAAIILYWTLERNHGET